MSTLDKRLTALERQQAIEQAVMDSAVIFVSTPEREAEVVRILIDAGVFAMPPTAASEKGQQAHANLRAALQAEGMIDAEGWPIDGTEARP